jgi:hypothetical protein
LAGSFAADPTDAIADFEGLLGSSARKTLQWRVFSENGSADPGGKSRNLQAADVGKGTARCAAVLCGSSLMFPRRTIDLKVSIASMTFVYPEAFGP